jgi:hypothetical protein
LLLALVPGKIFVITIRKNALELAFNHFCLSQFLDL